MGRGFAQARRLWSGDVAGGDDLACFAAGGGPAEEAGERAAWVTAGEDAERAAGRVAAVFDCRACAADVLVVDGVYGLGEREVDVAEGAGCLFDVVAYLG